MAKLTKPFDYTIYPEKSYSIKDAAKLLGGSPETIRKMAVNNEIKAYRVRPEVKNSKWAIKGKYILKHQHESESFIKTAAG